MTLAARGVTVAAEIDGRQVEVLRALDFDIAPGRILGLVGESGAGKSMIGRVVARALPSGFRVTAGTLDFRPADGPASDLLKLPPQRLRDLLGRTISFIPQEPQTALNPLIMVGDQFSEHLARLGVPGAERWQRIADALAEVRLPAPEALMARYPFQLSGGMCQRVLIAMAFAGRPALVIADEPTTALDVSTQATVVRIMRRLQREYRTALLFITHDLRLASHVCDEIAVLYAGEVVERGPARAICEAPLHPYTRALLAANPPLTGPLRRLVALPDRMPGLAALGSMPGCRFAPRCATADPSCRDTHQPLREIAPGRWARCADACRQASARPAGSAAIPIAPCGAGAPVLAVAGLARHYPGRRDWLGRRSAGVDAVRGVSLMVQKGEILGVVGESGSGKSTLARLIMGLEPPTAGHVRIDGRDVGAADAATRAIRLGTLQLVFQDPQSALNPRRSIERLVTQSMERPGAEGGGVERRARARALLDEVGLPPDLVDRYPSQLSGGQKQRVNIARALCITPRLLIADEIVSGLDVSVQAQVLNLLQDLRSQRGIGLLFISHDLAVVRYLCSRVLVMRHGLVVEEGETAEVFGAPRHPYTRMLLAAAPPEDLDRPWPPEAAELEAADAG